MGRMADLLCLKKCGKIQNVESGSDFEIFSPEMHALALPKSNIENETFMVIFNHCDIEKGS